MARAWRRRAASWERPLEEREAEDSVDGVFGVIALDRDVVVGAAVALQAGVEQLPEDLGIARQGPVGGLLDAALHDVEGAVQPDGDAVSCTRSKMPGWMKAP